MLNTNNIKKSLKIKDNWKEHITFYNFFFLIVILGGMYIWLFDYIPAVLFAEENRTFYFARDLFFYLQIITDVTGFMLFFVIIKNRLSVFNIFIFFCISTILVKLRLFNNLHDFLKFHELYFDIFKTRQDGTSVSFFQYARVLALGIIMTFAISAIIYLKKTVLKVFTVFFIISFYLFFYFMHAYIGRELYVQSTEQLTKQIDIISKNYEHQDILCKELEYHCVVLNNNENYKHSIVSVTNSIRNGVETKEESDKIINEYLKEFIESNENTKIYSELDFETDNLRAVSFAFQKIDDNKTLILQDNKNLAFMLDLYLIYFSFVVNVFLIIWGYGIVWLYRKHKNMDRNKNLEKIIN